MRRGAAQGFLVAAFACATLASAASAPLTYQLPQETAALKPGPGVETAAVCGACHSVDYLAVQPPHKGRAFWDAEVQKMIKVFKAAIDPKDAAAITDDLAATY